MGQMFTLCVFLLGSLAIPVAWTMSEGEYDKLIFQIAGCYGNAKVQMNGTVKELPSIVQSFRPIQQLPALSQMNGRFFLFKFTQVNNVTQQSIMRVAFENQKANVYYRHFSKAISVPTGEEESIAFIRSLNLTHLERADIRCHWQYDVSTTDQNSFIGSNINCKNPQSASSFK